MRDKEACRRFTTTLPVSVLLELDRAAKETRRRKNDILIEALSVWMRKYEQTRLAASYEGKIPKR